MGSFGNSRKRSTVKARLRRRLSLDKQVVAVPVEVVEPVEVKPKVKRTVKKKAEGAE